MECASLLALWREAAFFALYMVLRRRLLVPSAAETLMPNTAPKDAAHLFLALSGAERAGCFSFDGPTAR